MFSENERISDRQFRRLLTLELFGVTTVLLPQLLCQTVQRDGVTALALGLLFACIYGFVLHRIGKLAGRSLQLKLKKKNRILYEIFLFVMLIQMLLMGIWVLNLCAQLSRDILLESLDIRVLILTFSIVSLVGAFSGMESRGRMAEVLYLILLLPFLILLFLAAAKGSLDGMPVLFTEPPKTIVRGSYEVFIVFQGVTLGFFALPYLKNQKTFWKGIRSSLLLNGLFCFLLMTVAVCIFGIQGAAAQEWLAVNLMTTPDFPGGLVERLDVLMVTIWIVALYFFLSGTMFYGGKMAGRLFGMKKERLGVGIVGILITLGSLFMGNRDYAYFVYLNYMKYIGVPLLLFLLLIIWVFLRPRKAAVVMSMLLLVVSLGGCAGGVELEDREFLLTLGVNWDGEQVNFYYDTSNQNQGSSQNVVRIDTDRFTELEAAYGQQADQYLDGNHLKAILIGQELAQDEKKLEELLAYIEKDELFARNVKLFYVRESLDDVFKDAAQLDTTLGEYLENMYVDSNSYMEDQSTTLGDLQKHRYEKEEPLFVPVIKIIANRPMLQEYALVKEMCWQDSLESAEADLIFLGNGVSVQREIRVDDDCIVQLETAKREINFTQEENVRADITLKLKGRIINKNVGSEKEKADAAKALEKKLEEWYQAQLPQWKEADLLHVCKELGSHSRSLYLEYEKEGQKFYEDMDIHVKVQAKIL